jgi:hypothetical protein
METAKPRNNFMEFIKYMIPVKGDVEFDRISKGISSSKLERITADIGFCTFKYLAYSGILWGVYRIINDLYTWKNGADIPKGF